MYKNGKPLSLDDMVINIQVSMSHMISLVNFLSSRRNGKVNVSIDQIKEHEFFHNLEGSNTQFSNIARFQNYFGLNR